MTLQLPYFVAEECATSEKLNLNISNLSEMRMELNKNYPKVANAIFQEDGNTKMNVVFALNGEIASKETISNLKFNDNTNLQIYFQFAGG